MSDEAFGTLRPFDALSPRGLAGKREYVLDLERRADPDAIALLVECLIDESGYLRDLAGGALVRVGAPAAPILPLLSHGLWFTRGSAARTLGRLGARDAARSLANLLSDSNESVTGEAVQALISIARAGGAVHVARALFVRPEVERTRALREARARDADVARRFEELFRDRDLMLAAEDELLGHDTALKPGDDGVAWEILTGDAKRGDQG